MDHNISTDRHLPLDVVHGRKNGGLAGVPPQRIQTDRVPRPPAPRPAALPEVGGVVVVKVLLVVAQRGEVARGSAVGKGAKHSLLISALINRGLA